MGEIDLGIFATRWIVSKGFEVQLECVAVDVHSSTEGLHFKSGYRSGTGRRIIPTIQRCMLVEVGNQCSDTPDLFSASYVKYLVRSLVYSIR